MAFLRQGQVDEAIRAGRKLVEVSPEWPTAHHQLGLCLQASRQFEEAMAEHRRAIELDPKGALSHYQLGVCWRDRGRLDEAMAEYRRAIELDPKGAPAHHMLARCLQDGGRLDEAVAEHRRAVECDPRMCLAHEFLVEALLRSGRFAEARTAARRGLDSLPANEPRRPELQEKLKRCERMLALDARLPTLLQAKERSAAAEQLELARLCRDYGRPHGAAGLYAAAFAGQPALAEDLQPGHRYNAACTAALAGCGQGKDATDLGETGRARLRRQALDWLRADLDAWRRLVEKGPEQARPAVVQQMQHWQQDSDFAGVRGAALAPLPEAERHDWQRLWADVADTLARAQGKGNPPKNSRMK
jgi:tetratricopeptide (TPR) repeat protein